MQDGLDKLAGGLGKAIETAPALYDDALKPTAQETGKLLGRIPRAINAALSGIDKWILNKEYNVEETKKLLAFKLKDLPPENIVTPDAYVAVPAIQAISYTMDSDELRDLYANLLAKSMNTDEKHTVHPAYVETIKQLSPNDASYFKHLSQLKYRPMINTLLELPNSLTVTLTQNTNSFSSDFKDTFPLSIDNLKRLGLITIPEGIWYGDDSIYESLLTTMQQVYKVEHYKGSYPQATGIEFVKTRIDITTYGLSFYKTCVI